MVYSNLLAPGRYLKNNAHSNPLSSWLWNGLLKNMRVVKKRKMLGVFLVGSLGVLSALCKT
jgi:hypothetical protein